MSRTEQNIRLELAENLHCSERSEKPPVKRTDLRSVNLLIWVWTWRASSRVGSRMMALCLVDRPWSWSRATNSERGRRKDKVLPVPVRDLKMIKEGCYYLLYDDFATADEHVIACFLRNEKVFDSFLLQ